MAHLVNLAGGDTTNPKWGYVSRFAHLACTSRGYVPVESGVRIGDGRKVSVGKKFKWELPETEEGWTRGEAKQAQAGHVYVKGAIGGGAAIPRANRWAVIGWSGRDKGWPHKGR